MNIKALSPMIPVIQQYGYIAVIVITMIEGASIPFPGSGVLFIVGFIVSLGELNMLLAILLGAFFYTIASILPYYIGKTLKGRLLGFLERFCNISKEKFTRVERVFHEYGEVSVCLSRPFFIGNYISYLAGVANVNVIRYFVLTFIGIVPWVAMHMGLGYFFRGNFSKAMNFLKDYGVLFIIIFALLGIFVIFIKKKGYNPKEYIKNSLINILPTKRFFK